VPLLAVENLQVEYAALDRPGGAPARAVDGVSLRLEAGQVLGLCGESGCGKTSTLLALLGLLPAGARARGAVLLAGQDLLTASEAELSRVRGRSVSLVFQGAASALSPVRTIGDQVGEPLRIHLGLSRRAAFERAVEELGRVGLPDPAGCARSLAHQLSGGMQKRALLAMALACRPQILLCDEPTAGLDVTVQAAVMAMLAERRRRDGTAVLLATHDLPLAAEQCDDLAVMYAGQLIEYDRDARAVLTRPTHPYTAALCAAMPGLKAASAHAGQPARPPLPSIAGTAPSPSEWPAGCRFAARCPFVVERCRREAPELRPLAGLDAGLADARQVRCHFPRLEAAA